MEDLIKALQIFMKYVEKDSYGWKYPFSCEHDMIYVTCVNPEDVSKEDTHLLETLGFDLDDEENCFVSTKFGSS